MFISKVNGYAMLLSFLHGYLYYVQGNIYGIITHMAGQYMWYHSTWHVQSTQSLSTTNHTSNNISYATNITQMNQVTQFFSSETKQNVSKNIETTK